MSGPIDQDVSPRYDARRDVDQGVGGDEHERRARVDGLLASEAGFSWRRCAMSVSLMLVVIAASVVGGLYWRLGKGPISATIMTEHALRAIGSKLPPGYGVELSDVALARQDGGLAIVVTDLVLRDAAGSQLAAAPRIAIDLSPVSLLTGAFEPRSIVVDGASATLSIGPDGQIGLRAGMQDSRLGRSGELSVPAMVNALDALMVAAGSIDQVELRNASLVVNDKTLGHEAAYRDISVSVRRTAAQNGLAFSLEAGGGTVNATIEGRGDGARFVDMQARGVSLRDIAMRLAPSAPPPAIEATIDAVARAKINADGALEQASLGVTSTGGSWRVEPDLRPFLFDEAALGLHWDGAARAIVVERAMLRSGEGVGVFTGRIAAPKGGDGDWRIELDGPGMTIASSDPEEPPLKLDVASIRGRYDPSVRRLGIDHAAFSGPTAGLAIAGSLSFEGRTPGIGLGIAAGRMPATAMKRFWPFFAAAPAREWFVDHVKGGMLEAGTLSLAIPNDALVAVNGKIPPLPESAVTGALSFTGGRVKLLDTLPLLTDVRAAADFTARRFTLRAQEARADLGQYGNLAFSDGLYEIADLVPTPAMQHVAFRASGPAAAIAELVRHEPMKKAAGSIDLSPDRVGGSANLHVDLEFPTVRKPKQSDFRYRVTGDLESLSIEGFEGQKLERGTMKLAIEPGVVLLTGKATLAGLPASIDYRKAEGAPVQITISTVLDDAARRKRGFDFGDALDGSITAEIRVDRRSEGSRYGVDLDFAAARVRDLLPGWQKPPGRPGKASFVWIPKGEGGTVENLSLESGPVVLRGGASIGSDGKLKRASLDTMRLGPGDDASASLDAAGDGWKVSVHGKSLDLRPILLMLQHHGGDKEGNKRDLAVQVQLDRADGFGNEALSGFDFDLETKDAKVRSFALKGSFGSRGITGGLRDAGDGASEIYVETVDAGSLLRFLDYYSHVDGGVLQAAATPQLDLTAGQIFMRDFEVRDETALGQYRSSLERSSNVVRDLPKPPQGGNSARFSKLRLTFERTPDRLTIAEAVVWGADVGVNLSGTIDYGADRVNLTGTFVPAYALNNLFSRIPVIGMILGGGQNEGMFAITFKVTGAVASPTLTVSPLSAIAPGFLRKLFEFQKQ
jgi:hypothetical protein